MTIRDWPEQERPHEKLLAKGPQQLSDAELLAIFIHTGIKGKSALDISRALLNQYSNLRNIIELSLENFSQIPGLGVTKFVRLQAALEIAKRELAETIQQSDVMTNSQLTKDFLKAHLHHHQQEVFACLFLDTAHRIIEFKKLFFGTIDHTVIHPREVVKQALHYNAAAVIFAHNHPSGIAKPSTADQELTQKLKTALQLVDIRVLDHIVIGHGELTSFAEQGLL